MIELKLKKHQTVVEVLNKKKLLGALRCDTIKALKTCKSKYVIIFILDGQAISRLNVTKYTFQTCWELDETYLEVEV